MKDWLKVTGSVVVVAAVLGGILALFIQSLPDEKEVSDFQERYSLVELGDTEEKVLMALGEPNAKEKEFHLGQRRGFENAYERAEASGSEYYLFWHKGIDVVFAVGINGQGKVSVKEYGGT